jgi:hypothetical protein
MGAIEPILEEQRGDSLNKACPTTVPRSFSHSIHAFDQIAERIAVWGMGGVPTEERLARSVNTMKILTDYMKRVPVMSLDFRWNSAAKTYIYSLESF